MRSHWLAWATGLLPTAGVGVAAWIAMRHGLVPACNPFLDGCTSISATGRQFPASLAFRAGLLPGAGVTVIFWLVAGQWLRALDAPRDLGTALVPVAGCAAAVFLVVYVSFLGTDADIYRWLRRFGVIHYFSMTYLAQLLLVRGLYRAPTASSLRRPLLALCAALLVLGLTSILIDLAGSDTNAVENIIEWNGAALMMAYFPLCALAWRRGDLRFTAELARGS